MGAEADAIEGPAAPGRTSWLLRCLRHRLLVRAAFAGAIILTLPALIGPLTLDDFVLGLLHRGGGGVAGFEGRSQNALFTFTDGQPASNDALIEEGVLLPWWTDRRHLNAFFRPLSSLSHRIDFALWPDAPLLMHLHSLLWFLLLLWAAHGVYRSVQRAVGPVAAGDGSDGNGSGAGEMRLAALALLLFAWDDAHGATLGWIANRNALIAGAVSLPAVVFHRRLYRSTASTPFQWLAGPACLAVGLCGGEAAIGTLGYLAAHALHLERGPLVRRALRLAPYAAVLVGWRVIYHLQGLGSRGSGAYHDPIGEPLAFLGALAQNLPVLVGAQFGPPYADAAFWGPPQDRPLLLLLSAAIIGLVLALSWPLLTRSARRVSAATSARARFYATGCVLAAVPVSASLPGERLLLLVGVGASGLVALLLGHYLGRPSRRARWAVAFLVAVHLVAAPLALPALAYSMSMVGERLKRADADLPQGPEVQDQVFVILNAPFDVMASYVQPMRAYERRPRPRKLHWLATASSPLTVTRTGPQRLVVTVDSGLLASPQARHYRRDLASLSVGAVRSLATMDVTVLEADPEAGPTRMQFDFKLPVDDPRLRFFVWRQDAFKSAALPPLGSTLQLPAQDFFQIVLPAAAVRRDDQTPVP